MVEKAEATEGVASGENSTKGMSRAVKDLRDAGNAHVAKGSWSRAINCYNKAIELDGNNAPLYSNRAAAEYLNQAYDAAFEDSLKAISIDPKWWKGYKWKGLSLIKLKRWVEAVEVLEKACEEFSDVAELSENLETARNELEHAQNLLYVLPGPEMMKKLDGIPVFIVTDEQGQPFFITYEDGQQVCTFYFQHSDAVSTLDWIKEENPSLGERAVVVVISLSQAFQMAQDTQQQYQKEEEAAAAKKAAEAEREGEENVGENGKGEKSGGEELTTETPAMESIPATTTKESTGDAEVAAAVESNPDGEDAEKAKDDDVLDADVPLAFQFRPELSQVEAAVELHNNESLRKLVKPELSAEGAGAQGKKGAEQSTDSAKVADSPVTPDVEEAKKEETEPVAETETGETGEEEKKESVAAADADPNEEEVTVDNFNGIPIFQARGLTPATTTKESTGDAEVAAAVESNADGEDAEKAKDDDVLDADVPLAFQFRPELSQVEAAVELHNNESLRKLFKPELSAEGTGAQVKKGAEQATESAKVADSPVTPDVEEPKKEEAESVAETETAEEEKKESVAAADADPNEEEVTVDNFNGIPIFQARGLTLLLSGKRFIPLFFSKKDLEDAWIQLNKTVTEGIPEETEIDVGTLEEVLRRMVDGDAKEFENVIFVPTHKSLEKVGRDFPLDHLTNSAFFGRKKISAFVEAKKIAAVGGSKEAVREAIQKELIQRVDKERYAEQLDSISKSVKKPTINKPVTSKTAVKPRKKRDPLAARTAHVSAATSTPDAPSDSTLASS
eukprot:CAMPEP_0184754298 /NCGR_PEP_ID=MMETSP0315-20130426/44547_1 /TAXON_ID=101924 /ORGANISM="Rhodosorus marinus, Strain UTEX LB 2760" /LENGTH=790 /DNA_ID=CAMNT_0027233715 /DNA_START=84 /DNA_END=2456 /DNA_ORIENTATION=+